MKLINDIINLINAPYFITDDPYIEVFNPRITILEGGEYQYKIITERKNHNQTLDTIKDELPTITQMLHNIEPYDDVFKNRKYVIEIYEDNELSQNGSVDYQAKKLAMNKDCLHMTTHELGHVIDIPNIEMDYSDFDEIAELYKKEISIKLANKNQQEQYDHYYINYIAEPKEIFARMFQRYYIENFEVPDKYQRIDMDIGEIVAKTIYDKHTDMVTKYYDVHFPEIYEKTHRYFSDNLNIKDTSLTL